MSDIRHASVILLMLNAILINLQFFIMISQEGDRLKNIKNKLEDENKTLANEKEMNTLVIQQKVSQSKQQKQTIKEVSSARLRLLLSKLVDGPTFTTLWMDQLSQQFRLLPNLPHDVLLWFQKAKI